MESLSITNATVLITSEGSFDLVTYGMTEDPLISWTVSYVEILCLLWNIMLCGDWADVSVNSSSSELKKNSLFSIFLENIGNKYREHKT